MGAIMEAKFQIFLILLAVLAGTTLLARHQQGLGHPWHTLE